MSDPDEGRVARCDYCGTLFPLSKVVLYWVHVYNLEDGREQCTTGLYCSEPCGEWSESRVGASRG
jgi:hypothetical protein